VQGGLLEAPRKRWLQYHEEKDKLNNCGKEACISDM
jgi:hypothetical protein